MKKLAVGMVLLAALFSGSAYAGNLGDTITGVTQTADDAATTAKGAAQTGFSALTHLIFAVPFTVGEGIVAGMSEGVSGEQFFWE